MFILLHPFHQLFIVKNKTQIKISSFIKQQLLIKILNVHCSTTSLGTCTSFQKTHKQG